LSVVRRALYKERKAEKMSRAKAQSAAAFLEGFLCAFARDRIFFPQSSAEEFEYFLRKALSAVM